MIRLLLAFLLVAPAHAGVLLLKDSVPQNRRWVYDDYFTEIVLTDKQVKWCLNSRYLYAITIEKQKIEGCWEEIEELIHISYDSGQKLVVRANKFIEKRVRDTPIIKLTENERP